MMGLRLWSILILIQIVLISTSNTQTIENKLNVASMASGGGGGGGGDSNSASKKEYEKPMKNLLNKRSINSQNDRYQIENNNEELIKTATKSNDKIHSRKKRLIWVADDGRLALPPGTVLSISPTISLPLVRYPPEGFLSNLTLSFPLTIDFDKLGLTDNENPLGILPPIFGRSMGRAAGNMLVDYIEKYLHSRQRRETNSNVDDDDDDYDDDDDDYVQFKNRKRNKRSLNSFNMKSENSGNGGGGGGDGNGVNENELPKLPDNHQHVFHGGERVLLYGIVEDLIGTFGLNGKACILRAICEIQSKPIHNLGLFGEMAKLFFTVSKSRYSDLLPEYVLAEQVGNGSLGPGECFPYYKDCPRSLFKSEQKHKYRDPDEITITDDDHTVEHRTKNLENHHRDRDRDNIVELDTNEINEINHLENKYQM